MNKLTNILLTLGVTLFLLSFGMKSEAVGQCEPGYSPVTVNMNIGNCVYEVNLCVKCSPLGLGATKVKINHTGGIHKIPTTPACTDTLEFSEIVDYAMAQLQTPACLFNILCPNTPDAPPCDGPNDPITYTIYYPLCWQGEVIEYFGRNEFLYRPCSDDVCEVTYSICVDGSGAYQRTLVNPIDTITPSCTYEAWQAGFPADDAELQILTPGYTTECFIYHSDCNP